MTFPTARYSFRVVLLLLACASFAFGCDRGIEPFDPTEGPALPKLDRIYPEGARQASRPGPAVMPNPAAPAGRGEPSLEPSGSAPGSGDTIKGRVEIAEALYGSRPDPGMLFIIARKQPTGPPLAVLRVPTPSFPVEFEIGQAQVMIPSLRFEGEVTLSARLDSDGNAMTKLPGDLTGAIANPLPPGSSGITLVLDQQI